MNPHLILQYFLNFFSFGDRYQDLHYSYLNERKFSILCGILLFLIAVLWRSWDNFCNPGLHVEDSMYYFNPFYGNYSGSIGGVLHQYNGYYVFLTKFVAYLIAKADVTWQPFLYQFFALGVCTLTILAFSCSGLITNRYLLLISPILLGLSGLNHLFYFITICYQVYVIPILLLLLLLSRIQTGRVTSIIFTIIFFMLIWSSPFSVLAVPFCLTYLILFRDRNFLCLILIIATIAYTLTVAEGTVLLGQLFYLEILAHWGITLVTDVFFMGFVESVNTEKLFLVFAVFSTIFIILHKDRHYLKTSILILVIIVASFAPFFLSIKFLLYRIVFPSHAVIAQFFWLIFILFTFDKILCRFPKVAHVGLLLLTLSIILFVLVDNMKNPEKRQAEIYRDVPQFIQTIKKYEPLAPQLAEKGKKIVISTEREGIFNAVAVIGDRSEKSSVEKKIGISNVPK